MIKVNFRSETFLTLSGPSLSQCNTNIFEYSNNRHRIIFIRIQIFNFLVLNIFDFHIRVRLRVRSCWCLLTYTQGRLNCPVMFWWEGAYRVCLVYIQYSYLSKLLRTNIFVFSKPSGYEYIRYSYSVKISFTNIFVFGQEFDIRVTLE